VHEERRDIVAGGEGRGPAGEPYRPLSQQGLRTRPNGTTETMSQLGSRFTRVSLLVAQARILGNLDQMIRSAVSFSTCNVRFQVVLTQSVIVSRTGTGGFLTSLSSK